MEVTVYGIKQFMDTLEDNISPKLRQLQVSNTEYCSSDLEM